MQNPSTPTVRSQWRQSAFPLSVALLAFCIPVINYGIQLPIILMVVSWVFYPKAQFSTQARPFAVFVGVFAFYLIAMTYTGHQAKGWNDLVQKLSLLLFPLLLATARPVPGPLVRLALRFFAMGTVVALLIAFGTSAVEFFKTGDLMSLYMSRFSPVHHPSYLAMFVNFSIVVLLLEIDREKRFHKREWGLWVVVLVLALSLIFPASKMGFVNFGLVVLFFLVKRIADRRFFRPRTALLVAVAALFALFLRLDPLAMGRLETAASVVQHTETGEGEAQPEIESTTARLYIWQAAWQELRMHPFGVGTGDVKPVLQARYAKQDLSAIAAEALNAHNQFLQIALAVGIPGALWFVFSLVYPFGRIRRHRQWIYAYFILAIALNFTVESMLEKQSGVVFYSFFNALLYFSLPMDDSAADNLP